MDNTVIFFWWELPAATHTVLSTSARKEAQQASGASLLVHLGLHYTVKDSLIPPEATLLTN